NPCQNDEAGGSGGTTLSCTAGSEGADELESSSNICCLQPGPQVPCRYAIRISHRMNGPVPFRQAQSETALPSRSDATTEEKDCKRELLPNGPIGVTSPDANASNRHAAVRPVASSSMPSPPQTRRLSSTKVARTILAQVIAARENILKKETGDQPLF